MSQVRIATPEPSEEAIANSSLTDSFGAWKCRLS
jgi:hypothetical protein